MSRISNFKMDGAVPAVFTPMTKDGEVDLDKIEDYCKYLVENGISQVFVNGTTGEGPALTLEERTKVVEKWIDAKRRSGGKLKDVIVQVGALNLHDTKAVARHAASVGADAISTLPPLFFKPKTVDYLVKYCKEVASVAPDLPFYYYHVPIMTSVQVNVEDFLKEGMKHIPSLVGAKFSSSDLVDLIGCANLEAPNREDKRFNFAFGTDAQLMSGIITGAEGGVGSTYNLMPRLSVRLIKNTKEGNITEARCDQLRVQQFSRARGKYESFAGYNVAITKAIMGMVGLDLGPSRSPYCGPPEDVCESLKKELEKIGFFEWRN